MNNSVQCIWTVLLMSVAVNARQQCATGTQRVCNCTSTNWKTCFAAAVGGGRGRRRLLEGLLFLDAQAHCRRLLLVALLRAASIFALTCSYSYSSQSQFRSEHYKYEVWRVGRRDSARSALHYYWSEYSYISNGSWSVSKNRTRNLQCDLFRGHDTRADRLPYTVYSYITDTR